MKILKHPAIRQSLGLVTGLIIGIVGAVLFGQSLPPEEGSVEERLQDTEAALRTAQQEIAALRADGNIGKSRRTVRGSMRYIAQRIRNGEDISLDDLFWTMKPWLRDMAPLFDRLRQVEQEERFDTMAGEFARKYGLSRGERDELKQWLMKKGKENAEEFNKVVFSDQSGFVEFMRVSNFDESDIDGIDSFMEARLEGEDLDAFKDQRLRERITKVEEEAYRRLDRIDDVVQLDDDQIDDMFVVMARSSKQFQAGMEIDGVGTETNRLERADRDAAIRSVLRNDQVARFEQHQAERRWKEERRMRRAGLTLPQDWQLLDDQGF